MIIGIDATNLTGGGGRTHLIEVLKSTNPVTHGISKIILWGNRATLAVIHDRDWIEKINPRELEKGVIRRSYWQHYKLSECAIKSGCDILFVPGGNYTGKFHPVVCMSRNMLPFEWQEMKRFGFSFKTLRYLLLKWSQSKSFRSADGVIFLTKYAKKTVEKFTNTLNGYTTVIHHGLDSRFLKKPKTQTEIENYSGDKPFRILYVSIINQYKHQWNVIEAVYSIREKTGWPLELNLIGPSYSKSLKRLKKVTNRFDPKSNWVNYQGAVSYKELHKNYHEADLGVFASSCENMPNILLEKMAAGLPIASSNRGPMPEILGEACLYFNPEVPFQITEVLQKLINSPVLRSKLSNESYLAAKNFKWEKTANQTYAFLGEVLKAYRENKS